MNNVRWIPSVKSIVAHTLLLTGQEELYAFFSCLWIRGICIVWQETNKAFSFRAHRQPSYPSSILSPLYFVYSTSLPCLIPVCHMFYRISDSFISYSAICSLSTSALKNQKCIADKHCLPEWLDSLCGSGFVRLVLALPLCACLCMCVPWEFHKWEVLAV